MKNHMVLVNSIIELSSDILGFSLAPATGRPLPKFEPGAHIDVYLPNGISRQYSLYNACETSGVYQIAVKLEPASRGGSDFMHSQVKEGDILQIGAPRNLFSLEQDKSPALLLAGGIGVTPILSMAQQLIREGREFRFEYFIRSREDAAFLDQLEGATYADRTNLNIGLTPQQTAVRLSEILSARGEGEHAYFCGPGGFIAAVRDTAARWPSSALHCESFSAAETTNASFNKTIEIMLEKSGKTLVVQGNQSIADALKDVGVDIEISCGQGICGTCRTKVLKGRPDHRDLILSDEEKAGGEVIMICVSRAVEEPLVLDL